MNWLAITRDTGSRLAHCELTHQSRVTVDVDVARAQHAGYVACLRGLGCDVLELPALDAFPDGVFIEDTALILPEGAVLLRPGAPSRRGEVASVEEALGARTPFVSRIQAPATVDGGDILVVGRRIFVGRSTRTNDAAIDQLRALTLPWGYRVDPVEVSHCLHLKSAATAVDDETVLLNPRWVDPEVFAGLRQIEVHPQEPGAGNVLRVGEDLVFSVVFPRTRERLERHRGRVHGVDLSELAKVEGAVTCCSLLLPALRA